jgi:hypothetical protein
MASAAHAKRVAIVLRMLAALRSTKLGSSS